MSIARTIIPEPYHSSQVTTTHLKTTRYPGMKYRGTRFLNQLKIFVLKIRYQDVSPIMSPVGFLNIKISSYQWKDSHYKDKTVSRPHLYWRLVIVTLYIKSSCNRPLQWRHNERDGVSNHQPRHCLLTSLFRRRSKKTSKLRNTGLCAGNSPGTGEFPAQRASNEGKVSIWWRHHVMFTMMHSHLQLHLCLEEKHAGFLSYCKKNNK